MSSDKKVIPFGDRALESRDAIGMISNKWTIAVIDILRDGPLRTSELQNAIMDVSPKVLTQRCAARSAMA
jgi:DNA-binding HxlR family transcriptional regulator